MTEVEFSRLLSDLATTAKALNEKSDSVNTLINRFQDTLRSINVGLEVWPVTLNEEAWLEEDRDGEEHERGSENEELGFTKHNGQWILATRRAYYDHGTHGFANLWDFVRADYVTPLLEASRNTRIEALKHFPQIAQSLQKAAEESLAAITEAERFASPKPGDKLKEKLVGDK